MSENMHKNTLSRYSKIIASYLECVVHLCTLVDDQPNGTQSREFVIWSPITHPYYSKS